MADVVRPSPSTRFAEFAGDMSKITGDVAGALERYIVGKIDEATLDSPLASGVTWVKTNGELLAKGLFGAALFINFYTSRSVCIISLAIGSLASASPFPVLLPSLQEGELLKLTEEDNFAAAKVMFGLALTNCYLGRTSLDDKVLACFAGLLAGNTVFHMASDSPPGKLITSIGEFGAKYKEIALSFLPLKMPLPAEEKLEVEDTPLLSTSERFAKLVKDVLELVGNVTGSIENALITKIDEVPQDSSIGSLVKKVRDNSGHIANTLLTTAALYNFYCSRTTYALSVGLGALASASPFPALIPSLQKGELLGIAAEDNYAAPKAMIALALANYLLGRSLLEDMAIGFFSGVFTGNILFHMASDSPPGKAIKFVGDQAAHYLGMGLAQLPFNVYNPPETPHK